MRPWDFGAHGPLRASGKSPMVERRTSVNRSPCGRRTSLGVNAVDRAPPCRQYTRTRREIPGDLTMTVASFHWSTVRILHPL